MNFNRFKTMSLALLLCATSTSAFAFIKEVGLGDNGVAYPQTSGVPRYNPAGIIDVGNRMDMGNGLSWQKGHTNFHGSQLQEVFPDRYETNTQAAWQPLGVFGICMRLSDKISVGTSLDATRTFRSKSPQGFEALGQGKLGVDLISPILLFTAAYKINDCHSIGVSLVNGISRQRISGLQNASLNSVAPNHVSNKGYDWAYGLGLRFGYLWHINPCLNFGFSYSTKFLCSTHFNKYRGLIPKRGLFEIPEQLYTGFAWKWHPKSTFAVQFLYTWWEHMASVHNPTFINPDIGPAGINTHQSGSSKGPSSGWRNGTTFSIGADYEVTCALTVRGGVLLSNSLFPRRETPANAQNNLFVLKNVLELGATYKLGEWDATFCYGHIFHHKVKGVPQSVFFGGTFDIDYMQHSMLLAIGKDF